MYLEKLEIQGFKSFANPITLVFNRDLTAIVGPNGSGKSNIADAVRWVLGEQSVKTLRGKKSEDVIFAGSDKKNRLGFAQVSLYLNNADKQADVDYEQIIITRKVERNGEAEYLINNNKVRLLDVQLLLAKANFGQRTYSVIGQGMIDSILVSSAQERKDFFDEATGVRQFQIKKNQATNKLTNAKENLEQTSKILAELEPRLRSLTRQVKKLERRESLAKELKDLQTDYYSFLQGNLDKELSAKRKDFDKNQSEVSDLNQKLIELQTKLEKEEKADSRQDSFDLLQSQLGQYQNELNTLLKEKTILEGKSDIKLMSSGKSDIVWLKQRIENLKNEINKNNLVAKETQNKLVASQSELDILEKKREQILADFSKLEESLLNSSQELSPDQIDRQVKDILRQQKDFQASLNSLTNLDDLPKLRNLAQSITDALSNFFQKIRTHSEDDRKKWQQEFNQMLISKDNLVSEIGEARTSLAVLENDLKQLKNKINQDSEELKKLEKDRDSFSGGAYSDDKANLAGLEEKIKAKNKEITSVEESIKKFNQAEENKKRSLVQAQQEFREVQAKFNSQNNSLNEVKVDLARLETKEEELKNEIIEEFPGFVAKKVNNLDPAKSKEEISRIKNQLSIIGGIDEIVVEEYQEVNERYTFLKEQSDDLNKAIEHLEKIIKDLEEAISKQFDDAFKNINKLFNQYFKKLFSGGKAELILDISEIKTPKNANSQEEDDQDNGEAEDGQEVEVKKQYGIEIKATPPGKKLTSINMLSGGEKALTSIALISAIIANNPSPFVVLDEVDAALDEANSIRFSGILEELSSKTQFVAITHNRATMHQAKIIYGVTMGDDGVSKLLSINFERADEIAA